MYSLYQFGKMMGDRVRMAAYEAALSLAVRPGDAVLDLGCGPGIMAMLACRAGARRVYAIDTSSVVDFGRQLVTANGLADRIEFRYGDSRRIELPERVDVVVADIRGTLPFCAEAILTLNDARARFLAEGGRMIPTRDVLLVGVVEAGEQYRALTEPWNANGFDLSASVPMMVNSFYHAQAGSQLVSLPRGWCVLDYAHGADARGAGSVSLPIQRDATGHGLILWFETTLFEDIGYSTGPENGENVYGRLFFPWKEPVPLFAGDEVRVELHADLAGGDYIWRWDTHIPSRGERKVIEFRQSTFYGVAFSPSALRKRSQEFVPVLSAEGQAEQWMLAAMSGNSSLRQIAEEATRRFPEIFRRMEDALRRAGELAERFSR